MSSKKPVKKEEAVTEPKSAQEFKAAMNFFFAGRTWIEGEVVDLPEEDLKVLLSAEAIK